MYAIVSEIQRVLRQIIDQFATPSQPHRNICHLACFLRFQLCHFLLSGCCAVPAQRDQFAVSSGSVAVGTTSSAAIRATMNPSPPRWRCHRRDMVRRHWLISLSLEATNTPPEGTITQKQDSKTSTSSASQFFQSNCAPKHHPPHGHNGLR